MPLHPDYDLAKLREERKKVADKVENRRVFLSRLPADAKEAIAAHCDAANEEDKQLHEFDRQIKAKLAEIEALKAQPAEEAQPSS